ncbi:hypothetical protein QJS10_CPB04g01618 [Acorus calamus]|uniref:Uncharacterized protein n=1 Tax=Acorus calamus TaxID=4465 RepID=A0AAV9F0P7_ACOCL|nr:hypothetical protein QJS10_CPB04g01618 [Acorus calamus]
MAEGMQCAVRMNDRLPALPDGKGWKLLKHSSFSKPFCVRIDHSHSGLASHDDGDDEDVREVLAQQVSPVQTPIQHVSPDHPVIQHESVVETPAQHIQHVSNYLHHIQHMDVTWINVNEEVEIEEELHWDAEDIDIEDVFIQDDEEHSMNSKSDESVEDKEVYHIHSHRRINPRE